MSPWTVPVFVLLGCQPTEPADPTDTVDPPTSDTGTPDPTTPEPAWKLDPDPLLGFLAAQQRDGLLESYVSHDGLPIGFRDFLSQARPMFLYDSSLAAIAWLGRGTAEADAHARAVLDGIVALQEPSGAVPSVVNAGTGATTPDFSSGNQAWAMLALLAGHDALGDEGYLLAAERIGAFLLDGAVSATDFGAITLSPGSTVLATEHNLDVYPAFIRLAAELPTSAGLLTAAEVEAAATRSRLFAESMFDEETGAMFTGTTGDGRTTSRSPIPLDTQSWGLLSLGRAKWIESYTWAQQAPPNGLWTASPACPGVSGPSFSTSDVGEVWTEGLAQVMAAARRAGDTATCDSAAAALTEIRTAAPNADGAGLVATCSEVGTGFGFSYYNSLHVGATAWAAIAGEGIDPYWFVPLDGAHPAADLPTVRIDPPAGATYSCTGVAPCLFTLEGTSAGVAGTGRSVYLLVEPLGLGVWFTQFTPAVVGEDGSFTVTGQLGSESYPVSAGDQMRLLVLVVDGAAPSPQLTKITPATVPSVVTTSGLLVANVQL